jgi:hypothetical protein
MIRKLILSLFALATAVGLTSCFQAENVIHLNKDGSGTYVEEIFLGQQVKDMLAQMGALSGGGEDKDPLSEMFSADKAKVKEGSLGEGVTFDKIEKINKDGKDGFRATYKFKDINKLKLDSSGAMDSMKPPGLDAEQVKKADPVTFAYNDGKLTIQMPKPPKKDENAPKPDPASIGGEQEEAMKQMFADMKVSIRLVADGGIDKTDASHVAGNTITLMEMDFGKLIQNPDAFKKLQEAQPETPEEIEALLKGVEGVKMETKEKVSVTLK